jgi:aryl-alcohol dehydrogenase-like predicted oxidoreductase
VETIALAGTSLETSKLIFGTSHILKAGTRKSRMKILQYAVDLGISHFDTAPLYGYGIAELDIGVLKKINPHITFSTKVGIYPPRPKLKHYPAILIQKGVSRIDPRRMAPRKNFDVSLANKSLNESLIRLQVECIDLFLIHEPNFDDINFLEWKKWLENLKQLGKIRAYGIAGEEDEISRILEPEGFESGIIQMQDSIFNVKLNSNLPFPPHITYGYFSEALIRRPELGYLEILQQALSRNRTTAMIFSSNNLRHIREIIDFMSTK